MARKAPRGTSVSSRGATSSASGAEEGKREITLVRHVRASEFPASKERTGEGPPFGKEGPPNAESLGVETLSAESRGIVSGSGASQSRGRSPPGQVARAKGRRGGWTPAKLPRPDSPRALAPRPSAARRATHDEPPAWTPLMPLGAAIGRRRAPLSKRGIPQSSALWTTKFVRPHERPLPRPLAPECGVRRVEFFRSFADEREASEEYRGRLTREFSRKLALREEDLCRPKTGTMLRPRLLVGDGGPCP
ncbi:hypothetical protein KM043_001744 [Ampulex compressa]|nr:hypothetical protein KM043_001744 [Ampulex compressa]